MDFFFFKLNAKLHLLKRIIPTAANELTPLNRRFM